ncbi:hypothetical protein [Halorhodospira sp. 9622]|uniref:hypothetical protein n=1 Tax=Halorhodospira sp. 9622 TaxID=2899136 RepID=UPI001EE8826D|nr:hypothetical protein [Halorhodospira sp. 9622]MCG5538975.1 hypothetical protein [Halorhodospira sp. 9622]
MSAIKLNQDELEALTRGEMASRVSHAAKLVYLLVIRPAMDYASGTAGRRRVISYQQLREALEYIPPAGSHRAEVRYSREQLRGLLREIERAGWVEWVKTGDRGLVFHCPLADTDQCGSTRNNPGATPEQPRRNTPADDTPVNRAEPHTDAGFHAMGNTGENPSANPGATPCGSARSNTPPEVRISGECVGDTHTFDGAGDTGARPAAGEGVCDRPRAAERRDQRFEDWWAVYPKKVGKKPAREKWKAKRLDARADELIADVQLRAGSDRKWVAGYVPNPTTYLTQERWNDEIERDQPRLHAITGGKATQRNAAAVQAFLEEDA